MRKKSQEGSTTIFLILIILLAVITGGILVLKPWQANQSAPVLQTREVTNTTATEIKTEPGLVWSYKQEVEFDGKNKFVELDKTMIEKIAGLQQGTVLLWFKFKKTQEGEFLPILYLGKAKGKEVASNWTVEIGHYDHDASPNARLYYTFYNENFEPFLCFDSGENLKPDTWYHFVGVNSESGNTGYLNGVELTNRHYNFSNAKDARFLADVPIKDVFYLGYGWFGIDQQWHYFHGAIKDIKVYNRVLTGQEIAGLAQNP